MEVPHSGKMVLSAGYLSGEKRTLTPSQKIYKNQGHMEHQSRGERLNSKALRVKQGTHEWP